MRYTLTLIRPERHLIEVAIELETRGTDAVEFAMPAWSPGRYYIYDFARNVQGVAASGGDGERLAAVKTDTGRWRVECRGSAQIRFAYQVYADTLSGTFSQFNDRHASINGSSVFMAVVGREMEEIALAIEAPEGWSVHTAMERRRRGGIASWHPANYDVLLDSPIEIGRAITRRFLHDGVTYHIILDIAAGERTLRSRRTREQIDRYTGEIRRIVEAYTRTFGRPEFDAYWFIANIDPWASSGDGMEHLASTRLVLAGDFLDPKGYDDLIAVTSHEFFHIWNVKRLRPRELGPFDYSRPRHTTLLWFAEGFTQYYGIITMARAGVWDRKRTLRELAAEINHVDRAQGRRHRNLRESSWDTWLAVGARSGAPYATNFPARWVNYYHKGAVVALVLDAAIRRQSGGRRSLDDVITDLYRASYAESEIGSYFLRGEGYGESDILDAVERVAGRRVRNELERMVTGTDDPYLDRALRTFGLALERGDANDGDRRTKGTGEASPKPTPVPLFTGLHFEAAADRVRDGFPVVAEVIDGSPADRAGLGPGDTILALDGERVSRGRWESVLAHHASGTPVEVTLFRSAHLMTLTLVPVRGDERPLRITEHAAATPQERRMRTRWLALP